MARGFWEGFDIFTPLKGVVDQQESLRNVFLDVVIDLKVD